jgi:type I restriction enzyme S subunit
MLDNLCSLISKGITPKYSDKSNQLVINQKCIRNKEINFTLARKHTPKTINEKWLRYGDILINSTGEGTLGRVAQFFSKDSNYTVDSHVSIIRPEKPDFLYYIGQWCLLRENEFVSMATGSTGQTDLPRERLKAMECLMPDDGTLDRFNKLIYPVIEKRTTLQQESDCLAKLRDTLLPRLMSGELLVANLAAKL